MIKRFVIVAIAVAFAVPAQAGSKVTLNGAEMEVSSEVAACFQTCTKQVDIATKKVEAKKKVAAVLAKKAEGAKGADKEKAKAEVAKENAGIAKLQGQIDQLKKRIEAAGKAAQDGKNDQLLKDMVSLGGKVETLRDEVNDLRNSIAALDRALDPVRIGPRVGALVWRSLDRTTYTGGLLGARLTLRSEKVDVFVEPFVALANQRSPFSVGIEGGVLVPFKDKFAVEVGPYISAHTINNALKAKSAIIALDLGLTFRPTGGLVLGLSGLAGCEFDQGTPAFAFGGRATVGWDF